MSNRGDKCCSKTVQFIKCSMFVSKSCAMSPGQNSIDKFELYNSCVNPSDIIGFRASGFFYSFLKHLKVLFAFRDLCIEVHIPGKFGVKGDA